MEVHLSADNEAQLSRIAAEQGRNADTLAQKILGDYLRAEAKFIEAIKLGEDALERGEYFSNEEVGAYLWQLINS